MSTIKHSRDTTLNSSSKTILTCPAASLCEVLQIHVDFTSTATVGNRLITMEIYDDTNTLVSDYYAGALQAASLDHHYLFAQGIYRETTFVNGELQCPFPFETILLPGWYCKIADSNAVDAAADDMITNIIYRQGNLSEVDEV